MSCLFFGALFCFFPFLSFFLSFSVTICISLDTGQWVKAPSSKYNTHTQTHTQTHSVHLAFDACVRMNLFHIRQDGRILQSEADIHTHTYIYTHGPHSTYSPYSPLFIPFISFTFTLVYGEVLRTDTIGESEVQGGWSDLRHFAIFPKSKIHTHTHTYTCMPINVTVCCKCQGKRSHGVTFVVIV